MINNDSHFVLCLKVLNIWQWRVHLGSMRVSEWVSGWVNWLVNHPVHWSVRQLIVSLAVSWLIGQPFTQSVSWSVDQSGTQSLNISQGHRSHLVLSFINDTFPILQCTFFNIFMLMHHKFLNVGHTSMTLTYMVFFSKW